MNNTDTAIKPLTVQNYTPNTKLTSFGTDKTDVDNIKYIGRSSYEVFDETGTRIHKKDFAEAVRLRLQNVKNKNKSSYRISVDMPEGEKEGKQAFLEFHDEMSKRYGRQCYVVAYHPKGVDTSNHNHVHILFFNEPRNPFSKMHEIYDFKSAIGQRFMANGWKFNYQFKKKHELKAVRTQAEIHLLDKLKSGSTSTKEAVWKEDIRIIIKNCLMEAKSQDEFEALLKKAGIKITDKTVIYTKDGDKRKTVMLKDLFSGVKTKTDIEAILATNLNLKGEDDMSTKTTAEIKGTTTKEIVNSLWMKFSDGKLSDPMEFKKAVLDFRRWSREGNYKNVAELASQNGVDFKQLNTEIWNFIKHDKNSLDKQLEAMAGKANDTGTKVKKLPSKEVVDNLVKDIKKTKTGKECIDELERIVLDKAELKKLAGQSTDNDTFDIKYFINKKINQERTEMRELQRQADYEAKKKQFADSKHLEQAEKIRNSIHDAQKNTLMSGVDSMSGVVGAAASENPIHVLLSASKGICGTTLKIMELMKLKRMLKEPKHNINYDPAFKRGDIKEIADRMHESCLEAFGEKNGRKIFYLYADEKQADQLEHIAKQEECDSNKLRDEIIERRENDIEYQQELELDAEQEQEINNIELEPKPMTETLKEVMEGAAVEADIEVNAGVNHAIDNLHGVSDDEIVDISDKRVQNRRTEIKDIEQEQRMNIERRHQEKSPSPELKPEPKPQPQQKVVKAPEPPAPKIDNDPVRINRAIQLEFEAELSKKGAKLVDGKAGTWNTNPTQIAQAINEYQKILKDKRRIIDMAVKHNIDDPVILERNLRDYVDTLKDTFANKTLFKDIIHNYDENRFFVSAVKNKDNGNGVGIVSSITQGISTELKPK